MSSKKSKLRPLCALAALATLALAVSCRGFFPGTTFTSLSIQPTPQVPLGATQGLQLWGTDSTTNETDQITSGASWTITAGTTGDATITGSGVATGTILGAITVSATYHGLSTSASGVVFLANITTMCISTSNTTGSCSPSTEIIPSSGGQANLYAIADYTNAENQTVPQDITTSATWTVTGPDTTSVTCSTTTSPALCEVLDGATAGTYTITVTYPETAVTATNTITVD
jgi:hypothetical protein